MKKIVKLFIVSILAFSCLFTGIQNYQLYAKSNDSRAIAIVFDNSGSMYDDGDQAWCRATYAMEVFASMLNEGDILHIYPMHPITIGDKEYTMNNPVIITDSSQASSIRNIFTKDAKGTPMESVDNAIKGLNAIPIEDKSLIVLTDGDTFSKNGYGMSSTNTIKELDKRIKKYAGESLKFMYLGIGKEACIPNTKESEYFVKRQAVDTSDVLSTLTEMCNMIFGRDSLPKDRISNNKIEFDISMKKLIVFVQGENIENLILESKDENSAKLVNTQSTKYSTKGAGNYDSNPDKSLQGMMVSYEDCLAGTYTIEYTGDATSIEVYYEPDAELEFIFTDSKGNTVDPLDLYEGDYKVNFGLKDAKTGELISSDLLGNPHYEGNYYINGEKQTFTQDGYSGEVPISLEMDDTFKADLTVNYLNGYTLTKDSSDFGFPNEGVRVIVPPLGEFKAELEVEQDYILIKEIEEAQPIIVNLSIDGNKLSEEEFDSVTLDLDSSGLEYTLTPNKDNSSYEIRLVSDKNIKSGDYKLNVTANYADKVERTAQASDSDKITLSTMPEWVLWSLRILGLIILLIILWFILHIRRLPKYVHTSKKLSSHHFDGDDVTASTNFLAEIKKNTAKFQTQYAGRKFGLSLDVKPGKESYLCKSQRKRSAEAKVLTLRKFGPVKINEAFIGSTKYILDEEKNKLVPAMPNQKPFNITNGTMIRYSGTINDAGIEKDFEVTSKLNFRKK